MTDEIGMPRRAPTSRDVAALAGVAQSTVSAAMSGNRVVAAETKMRIEAAMKRLGYQPNAGARTLRTNRTNVVALIVHLDSGVDSADAVPYIDAVVEQTRQREYDVVLSTVQEGADGIKRLGERSICDAFILMDIRKDDERVPVVANLGRPAVLVGRPRDAYGLDVVDFDHRLAAQMMVADFAQTGHQHIVVLEEATDHDNDLGFMEEFNAGASESANELGLRFTSFSPPRAGWRGITELGNQIEKLWGTKAGIIARTPRSAEWMSWLLTQRGFTVGQDISLAVLCTDDFMDSFEVPVSNVSPQPRKVSTAAVESLFDRLDGRVSLTEPGRICLVEPEGITRRVTTAQF